MTRRSPAERRLGALFPIAVKTILPYVFPFRTAVLALVAFAAACGVQGPPRPPRVEQPVAVKDFAVFERGKNLVFTFTLPTLATDGERLTKPLELEIFRLTALPAASPAGAPWKTLPESNLVSPSGSAVLSVALPDDELSKSMDTSWTFYLRSLTRGLHRRPILSEWSNSARVVLLNITHPVSAILIETTEKALVLRWSPPAEGITRGAAAVPSGYNVYRSSGGKPGTFALLGETPTTNFSDPNFQFDVPYSYFVRAQFKSDSGTAESDDSPIAEIIPRDTFPPAAPTNVTAVFANGSVDLIWTPNTEPDLAGYTVERRRNGAEWVRLNPKILGTPLYRDFSVETGADYIYRVRALDRAGNVSAPSPEIEVEAR